MDARERLSYYKRLQADGIDLTSAQKSDMLQIIKERGAASAEVMPSSGARHERGKREL